VNGPHDNIDHLADIDLPKTSAIAQLQFHPLKHLNCWRDKLYDAIEQRQVLDRPTVGNIAQLPLTGKFSTVLAIATQ
jgi:hypothetical protein